MEVSALKYSPGIGLHGRSPLLRLQSDERLIVFMRKGNTAAFEVLVSRYETRLLAFCRHLLGSREDAEDVLQEVLTAAFNAILSDERPINVRPWLYRIARNRSLNHLRRIQSIGVDSMDHHLFEHGASTADKVHEREEFRLLVGDIHELPETQRTALVLREMDALSYEQIAEAMETTVPSVKSLLVRARVSLAEAAEARLLSCDEVRIALAEVAEGLVRRPNPLVRRHVRSCKRCSVFRDQLRHNNKALAALLPIGPLVMLRKLVFVHLGHSAGAGGGATAAGSGAAGAAGTTAVLGSTAAAGSGGVISAGIGALAAKTAAGIAAAALVTAGAVEVDHSSRRVAGHRSAPVAASTWTPPQVTAVAPVSSYAEPISTSAAPARLERVKRAVKSAKAVKAVTAAATVAQVTTSTAVATSTSTTATAQSTTATAPAGRNVTQAAPTVLPVPAPPTTTGTPPPAGDPTATPAGDSTGTPAAASTATPVTTTTETATPDPVSSATSTTPSGPESGTESSTTLSGTGSGTESTTTTTPDTAVTATTTAAGSTNTVTGTTTTTTTTTGTSSIATVTQQAMPAAPGDTPVAGGAPTGN